MDLMNSFDAARVYRIEYTVNNTYKSYYIGVTKQKNKQKKKKKNKRISRRYNEWQK